ncbi:type II secretion system protein GspK [Verrucomicrobia bacterium]|jgi:type II secretory pathway component PulK|nr:type II secretion system protein GspK [Verrucomicrobiota bacterium]
MKISSSTKKHQKGSVLIIVLWISLGLVTIALLFGHSMMLEFRAAENRAAGWQAEQAVEAGLRYAIYLIKNLEEPGSIPVLETFQSGPVALGEAYFWYIGRANSYLSTVEPFFGIQDEAAKLNLNTATVEMLEVLPYMTPQFAAAIVDWRDEDEDPTENGAETETYLQLTPAYEAKNAPFDSIDELHMVYGGQPEFLYGEDINRNGVLDLNENDGDVTYPPDNQDGRLDPGILEYVTVYTTKPDTEAEGSQAIDLNNDEDDQLEELLEETFGSERADEISTPGGNTTYDSVLEYYNASGMTSEEFAQIEGRLTVSNDDIEGGLINVNTASEAVLACVPGIGVENAGSVVAQRQSNEPGTSTITWISDILDEEAVDEASPYLTGTTSHYLIDVAAVGRGGKGYRRTQFVVETSGQEPTIVARKNLPRLGWALGEQTRLQLAELKQNPIRRF